MTGSNYSLALGALREATCGKDVKCIIDRYGQDECNLAWKQLSSIERATLQLANAFQGTIIHDYQEPREERPPTTDRHPQPNASQW